MSGTNELSSIVHDDYIVPVDVRYTDFLNALSEIHDEAMQDRCYKYWTSLYRYFDCSMTNERVLMLEEKRTRKIVHSLDKEIASHQKEIIYQIRNIFQRCYQVLTDLYTKYNRKQNNLKKIEQIMNNLNNRIQNKNSESSSMKTIVTNVSSSTSLKSMMKTIDDLKLLIKNLQITRNTFEIELNNKKATVVSMQMQVYYIQQKIHKAEKELIDIEHQLTLNLQATHEQDNQLNKLLQYKLNISISIDQDYLNIDHQLIKEQLNNQQHLSIELQKQNKKLHNIILYHIKILKMNENKKIQLNINHENFIEIIHRKQKQIEKEKNIKNEIFQILTELKIDLKRKEYILSVHHHQLDRLNNQITELEHERDQYLQHTILYTYENINQSKNNIKRNIRQEINHRLQLSIISQNLKQQINILENTTQQYSLLVKKQRQKVINYEKLHDKWIIHINMNRNRILKLFNRINKIEQCMINTRIFFQQFDHIKLSLKSNILIFYNEINLFTQQRNKKNNSNNSKNLLNMKLERIRKNFDSNQAIYKQIKQTISRTIKNHSILLDQILTIDKQRLHLIQYINSLHDKWLFDQQQILNISKKFNNIQYTIDLYNKKFQQYTIEKQKIILFLLKKQYLIVFVSEHIELNETIRNKHQLHYNKLLTEIRDLRSKILDEIHQIKSYEKQHKPNMKQLILHLREELFEENDEQYCTNLQKKASSIIYRLICKTHYNIILHKHLDLLMQNTVLLYYTNQQLSKKSYIFYLNNAFDFYHLNNQLKASIAELRVLKNEILIYKQIYTNIKYSLKD
ncbi:unnamed protein product [Rotaria sp. Silwood1]|nr:unnamed protein product [Rotaria sp. Silwood1]